MVYDMYIRIATSSSWDSYVRKTTKNTILNRSREKLEFPAFLVELSQIPRKSYWYILTSPGQEMFFFNRSAYLLGDTPYTSNW